MTARRHRRMPSSRIRLRAALALGVGLCACASQSTVRREPSVMGPLEVEPVLFGLSAGRAAMTQWPAAGREAKPSALTRREPPMDEAALLGQHIANAATALLGKKLSKSPRRVLDDCTGLVRLAYFEAGVDLMAYGNRPGENGVGAIWRLAQAARATHFDTPEPGDLVFFVETYDRNRDGKRNDGRTHIGVVESVDAEGTVFFVHRSGRGVNRSRLNLEKPGRPLNAILRPAKGELRAYDTGELFAGFARPAALLVVAPALPLEPAVRKPIERLASRREP